MYLDHVLLILATLLYLFIWWHEKHSIQPKFHLSFVQPFNFGRCIHKIPFGVDGETCTFFAFIFGDQYKKSALRKIIIMAFLKLVHIADVTIVWLTIAISCKCQIKSYQMRFNESYIWDLMNQCTFTHWLDPNSTQLKIKLFLPIAFIYVYLLWNNCLVGWTLHLFIFDVQIEDYKRLLPTFAIWIFY